MLKARNITAICYLLSVLICIFLAFDFEGAIDTAWTLVLILLTLPLSVVSILFLWSLFHGAGLEFFAFMYLTFAGLNVFGVSIIINGSGKEEAGEIDE